MIATIHSAKSPARTLAKTLAKTPTLLQIARWLMLLVASTGMAAQAVTKADLAQAQARYQQERALCLRGQSQQDQATCLKEAGAALAEARRGGLDSDSANFTANQQQRCDRQAGDEQLDCLARMRGRGTTQGSVAGGGILRELVTREVMVPPALAASAPTGAASR